MIARYSKLRPESQRPAGECIRLRARHGGQWEESTCTEQRRHICQRPKDARCSWNHYGQSFYRFLGARKSFAAAKNDCMRSGGRLAIIKSTELNAFLTSILSPALSSPHCYWFGLNQSSDNGPFNWEDGTQMTNPMWVFGEPSNSTGRSCGCLSSDGNDGDNHGRWASVNCTHRLPYICERPQVPIIGEWIVLPSLPSVQYYFSSFSTNYFNASEYCQQIGGQLAQLKTRHIYLLMVDEFGNRGVKSFWFGLDDLSKEGDFRWSDGTLLRKTGFSKWHSDNPDNLHGWEHCVEYNYDQGEGWNDLPCGRLRKFICEKKKVPPLHLLVMTASPFGSIGTAPSFSCILSPDNANDTITYTERVVQPSLTTEGYSLEVPGTNTSRVGGFIQELPDDMTSVGVYRCTSTSTSPITGTSTSADVTILSHERHFQPRDGRLTKTIYPGDDITLSVSTTDRYSAGPDEIRWSTFSNFAEGSLSPEGDGNLTYTIHSATKKNADIYGTFQNNTVNNRLYSLIRVIVSDCPRGRWNLPLCDRMCDNCYNGGICHPQSGACICPPGFRGKNCLTACGKHRFGWECELECGPGNVLDACSGSQICLPDPYGCNCLSGYTGIYCDEQCSPGKYGVDCLQDCHCDGGKPCDAFTGRCEEKSPFGLIVGGAVGGIIIFLLIVGLVIIIFKRRRNRSDAVSKPVTCNTDGFILSISTGMVTPDHSYRNKLRNRYNFLLRITPNSPFRCDFIGSLLNLPNKALYFSFQPHSKDKNREAKDQFPQYGDPGPSQSMKPSEQTPLVDLPTPREGLDEDYHDYEVIRTAVEESVKDKPEDRRFPVPVSEFITFVESNRLTDMFSEEFLTLARICPDPSALLVRTGLEKCNRSKSRNANSHPFDRNRVILESQGSSGSNFIDASYVKGNRCRFITTQMPMPNTVADFWDVVFYNQPSVIIMLNDVDRRDMCYAQYWLDDGVATFGSFSVTTLSVTEKGGLIERKMEVTSNKSKTCHLVKQYQFLDWPTEAGQLKNRALQLINLMAKVEDAFKRAPEGFPVLVHCINGVGRTGVFCSTLECIAQVNEEGAVDVFKVVKMLRNERMHFVQTKEEYLLIYELIKEYLREIENYIQVLP
ncbi:uncharacterized protein LOC121424220 [Lytechinus variegatus]|uniref:uncharacterized protein LOC121424220 n=1 Tax=Lytechinus variegatus TaxID=7654 RepID=UPI001BB15D51|nr:uncharacterized protein LOC121424220 [Lytechinus variegatus]